MVKPHEGRSLKRFRRRAVGWSRPADHPGVSKETFDSLVAQGYLEEKYESGERFVQITEKGNTALDKDLW
jgi:hypothetical protein